MSHILRVAGLAIGLLLIGCAAAPPLDTQGVNHAVTPTAAAQQPSRVAGQRVLWGGTIAQARNLRDRTELEVLGYPLDSSLAPDTAAAAQGRFLVEKPGYLETMDFAPGRQITVVGSLQGIRAGKVGRTPYVFPVLVARQLYLWPVEPGWRDSNVHFGVGVGIRVH